MLCDNCQEREAEIHLTQIEDNEMKTLHLCEICAAEKGLGGSLGSGKAPLADFLAQMGEAGEQAAPPGPGEACPYCGTTSADFRRTGRLGCSQCYPHFEPQLRPLLRRIHGSTQHVGKVYLGEPSESQDRRERLTTLRRRLRQAIDTEDFESAARLRDEIRELELVDG